MTLTQQHLRSLLDYDPHTGRLTWRVSRGRVSAGAEAGFRTVDGYTNVRIHGHSYPAHRLAYLWMTGELPEAVVHRNGRRRDNRWRNLIAKNEEIAA